MKCNPKAAMILAGCLVTPAFSQQELPVCAFLDRLVLEAEQDFKSLRGPFDFSLSRYAGVLTTPGYTQCVTTVFGGSKKYECRRRMPDDETAARVEWTRLAQEAQGCFTGRTGLVYRSERSFRFKTKPHGADVSIRYQRLELSAAPTHLVTVQVSTFESE